MPGDEPIDRMTLINQVAALLEDEQAYLVGGAVRDMLLNRKVHDYDFAVAGSARRLARRVANALGGAFYMLDSERDTARVLVEQQNGRKMALDFAGLRSGDLNGDLFGRDFTINAIAQDIRDIDTLIDPLGGAADLRTKRLRACSPESLDSDPVRILRAVRVALTFGMRIDEQTRQQIKAALPKLANVSAERKRDELFRLLDGPKPGTAIRLLDQLGALEFVLPEVVGLKGVTQSAPHVSDVWEHTLTCVNNLENLFSVLVGDYRSEAAEINLGLAVLNLGRFRYQLEEHFRLSLNSERSLRALLFFAALYHDVAKPIMKTVEDDGRTRFIGHDQRGAEVVEERAHAIALSSAEVERSRTIVRQHMRLHFLAKDGKEVSRRSQYRFFRDTGPAGVDICLLSLADTMAVYRETLAAEKWQAELAVARTLLETWFERSEEIVSPPRLIDGNDLQKLFGVKPGPQIGDVLESIREKQAEGAITNRDEAVKYARNWLKNKGSILEENV